MFKPDPAGNRVCLQASIARRQPAGGSDGAAPHHLLLINQVIISTSVR